MLTSVECQQRADQKRAEAELHPRNRPRLLTARRSRESARARLADVGARARRRDGLNECARQSWCDPAGGRPAQVRSSVRLVASVAWPLATVVAKRTQRLHGVWD